MMELRGFEQRLLGVSTLLFFFLQEDLEILCKLEFSSPTCPLQLDADASSSSTGSYPSDNTPTVTLLIKSPALLRGV